MKQKFLLHVCCAPCAAHIIDWLRNDYDLMLYFYNPNIQPDEEYQKRLVEIKKYAVATGLPLIVGDYEVVQWLELTRGHENDPEKGERCRICYRERLKKTAGLAREKGCSWFGTTLTMSPYKEAEIINKIGDELSVLYHMSFYPADFKQNGGWQHSLAKARECNFYRQNYCGCIYSQ